MKNTFAFSYTNAHSYTFTCLCINKYVYVYIYIHVVTDTTTFEMELCGHKQATAHTHVPPHCVRLNFEHTKNSNRSKKIPQRRKSNSNLMYTFQRKGRTCPETPEGGPRGQLDRCSFRRISWCLPSGRSMQRESVGQKTMRKHKQAIIITS